MLAFNRKYEQGYAEIKQHCTLHFYLQDRSILIRTKQEQRRKKTILYKIWHYLYSTRNVASKLFAGKEIVIILLLPCCCHFCMPIREKNSYFYVWLLDDRSWCGGTDLYVTLHRWLPSLCGVYEYDKCLSMSDGF